VQIRYDDQPELQNPERAIWNDRANALVTSIEALLLPPTVPWPLRLSARFTLRERCLQSACHPARP
jgi:hypothetical protein